MTDILSETVEPEDLKVRIEIITTWANSGRKILILQYVVTS